MWISKKAVFWEDSYVFTFRFGTISKLRVLTLFLVLAWTKNSGHWLWKLFCVCPFEKKETVAVYFGVDFQGRDTARRVSLPLNRRIPTKVCQEVISCWKQKRDLKDRDAELSRVFIWESRLRSSWSDDRLLVWDVCVMREREILETHFTVPLFLSGV